MKDLHEILRKFSSSKFLVAERTKGLLCPGSMRIVDFQTALNNLRFWGLAPEIHWWWSGMYLVNDDGSIVNVHREIRALVKSGLLQFSKEECDGQLVMRIRPRPEDEAK